MKISSTVQCVFGLLCLCGLSISDTGAETAAVEDNSALTFSVCPSSATNPRNSEGDIEVLNDGSLLLAWSRFSGSEDHAQAVIAAKISRDGGRTWEEERILQENTGKQNVMSVSLLRLQSGAILFFFLQKNADDDLQLYVRESRDEAKTWSDPLRVTQGDGYFIMNNARAIQLQSGRILAPIAFCPDIGKDYLRQVCFCYYSDDEGKHWQKGSGEVALPGTAAMEPGLIERKDGSEIGRASCRERV